MFGDIKGEARWCYFHGKGNLGVTLWCSSVGNCLTHTNITSFTFYNDFIIKSKKYKKVKCLCFHLVKFTFFYITEVSMGMPLFAHATLSYVSEQNTRISTLSPYLIV